MAGAIEETECSIGEEMERSSGVNRAGTCSPNGDAAGVIDGSKERRRGTLGADWNEAKRESLARRRPRLICVRGKES